MSENMKLFYLEQFYKSYCFIESTKKDIKELTDKFLNYVADYETYKDVIALNSDKIRNLSRLVEIEKSIIEDLRKKIEESER